MSEVKTFGTDYDGSISAGKDGWECPACENWNRKSDPQCRFCVRCNHCQDSGFDPWAYY